MTEISKEITQKIAKLSRLELSESELGQFTEQLGQIIHYVEQLQSVNTEGVSPMTHPLEEESLAREDINLHSDKEREHVRNQILSDAPETLNQGFKVPPVF